MNGNKWRNIDSETVSYASLLESVLPGMLAVGLPPNEMKVYLALFVEPNIPASRISEVTGIPDSKIYGLLDNATRMNMIEVQYGVPKLYRAANPPYFLSKVRDGLKERFEKDISTCDMIEATLHDLYSRMDQKHGDEEGMEIAYVVKVEGNIVSRMKEMALSAREYITAILPDRKLFMVIRGALLEAKLRGAEIRIALPEEARGELKKKDEDELFTIRTLSPQCNDTWLIVADGRILNVSRSTADASVSAILTRDRIMVQMAEAYFDSPICCSG